MSMLDKVVAAVTPMESDEERSRARAEARAAAVSGGWLALALDHHVAIEAAFAAVRQAPDAATRTAAQKRLAALLTGHATAEETVLYPALALQGEKAHATEAYTEQAATKVQMAALEELDPMSQEYLDKLEHIRGAVAHHVYEEESDWFPSLQSRLDGAMQTRLAARYEQEFARYADGAGVTGAARGQTARA
jgi:hypothetical protein